MKISVIVCTRDRNDKIYQCIDSILKSSYENFELILVDQNDIPTTLSVKNLSRNKNYVIKHVLDDHKGLSCARNVGISHASGDVIAFTDDDCIVDEHW